MMEQRHVAVDEGEVMLDSVVPGFLVETEAALVRDGGARFDVRSEHIFISGSHGTPVMRLRVWRGTVRLEFGGAVYVASAGQELVARPDRAVEWRVISA